MLGRRAKASKGFSLVEEGAFAAFYRDHSDRLLAFVLRRVFDPELALDLTADTFAVAFMKRDSFRGRTRAEAEAWLYAIANRKIIRYRRRGVVERKAVEQLGLEIPPLTDADLERLHDLAGSRERRQLVAEELRNLSAEQQEALTLRIVEELSYEEVAERLGLSEQAARARVSRGLAQLGKRVERREGTA